MMIVETRRICGRLYPTLQIGANGGYLNTLLASAIFRVLTTVSFYFNLICTMAQYHSADREITLMVGARIRCRRTELNLSQEELGLQCGLHRTYIGAVERGEKRITVVTLGRIARSLQVSLADLVTPNSENP